MGIKALIVVLLLLSGCTERYRYPCQDPNNWNKSECNIGECEIQQTCTVNLIGSSLLSRSQ